MALRFFVPTLVAITVVFSSVVCHAKAEPSGGGCTLVPPIGYRVQIGEGHGGKAAALEEARAAARETLIESVCAPLTDARCDGVRAAIRPWGSNEWEEGYYEPSTRYACAIVAIEESVLTQMEREERQLELDIAAMADDVSAMGVDLIWHEDPIWESDGCGASDLGDYLRMRFNNALKGPRLDRGQTADPAAARFQMGLGPGMRSSVIVTGYLDLPGVPGWTNVSGPEFKLDLFGLQDRGDSVDCLADRVMGLRHGTRVGSGGLRVWIDVDGGRTTFCEGETASPVVRVNQPARVQVFSVMRDGTAHLLWPLLGTGNVDDALELGEATFVANPEGGDESLVAIAATESCPLTVTRGWSGYCLAGDDFGEAYYPDCTAVDRISFAVRPPGEACGAVDVSRSQDKLDATQPCAP